MLRDGPLVDRGEEEELQEHGTEQEKEEDLRTKRCSLGEARRKAQDRNYLIVSRGPMRYKCLALSTHMTSKF